MCGLSLLLPIVLWQTAALAPQPAADKEEVDNNNNSLANHQQPSPAVLWNSKWPQFRPDTIATDRRADLLRSFGIAINTNAGFWGTGVNDPINTMGAFGLWPHFLPGTGAPFNGGLPQKGNLTLHLQRVRADITRYMPHPDYTGHAVVDFENWAPAFDANNFGARGVVAADYQKLSRDDVRRRHPRWSAAEIEALARSEFDTAARKFFEETLLLGKAMRPHASWGFYGFPSCGKWTHGRECPSVGIGGGSVVNDQLGWLWNASDVLFPSIYLCYSGDASARNISFVEAMMNETHRVLQGRQRPPLPIVPFIWPDWDDKRGTFLPRATLSMLIDTIADYKASGLVLCGVPEDAANVSKCGEFEMFLNGTLGPILRGFQVTS